MKYWKKLSQEAIKKRVFEALEQNVNYVEEAILGVPASHLDNNVFYQDAAFLKDAPFLSSLVHNPNHIGCHTLGNSERYFAGTQEIEKEVIEICACDILGGEPEQQDGYIASGGTEANVQAVWVYRNYFMREHQAKREEICIICSEDNHYSMDKAGNLLALDTAKVQVNEQDRSINAEAVSQAIQAQQAQGKKFFIVIANMMTTMFGSVDDINAYVDGLQACEATFRLHVDGAYGGFYYPLTDGPVELSFKNPHVSSVTLDAHKMAQAPYGTGIFLIRKGLIHYANTKEASYVEGEDYTLVGSRSGANAVAVWMILMKNGPYAMQEKVYILQKRTEWLCKQLEEMGVSYFRHSRSNIVTIRSEFVDEKLAHQFGLVPDNHHSPKWFKVVVMDHVTIEKLMPLVEGMKASRTLAS